MAMPAVDRQADQRQDAAARDSTARQPDRNGSNGAPLGLDVKSLLALQATAGNTAVAALLARASSLPPGPLLSGLGGVAAAMTRAGRHEQDALAAAPPSWQPAPDAPAAQAPAPGPAPETANVGNVAPVAARVPAAELAIWAAHDPDAAELQHQQSAFHQALDREAELEARAAAQPAGEHAVVAEGGEAPIMATAPATAPLVAPTAVRGE